MRGYISVRMSCGGWLPIEKMLKGFFRPNRQVVWAVFDCDRNNIFYPQRERKYLTQGLRLDGPAGGDEPWPEMDETQVEMNYGIVFTYATKLGQ